MNIAFVVSCIPCIKHEYCLISGDLHIKRAIPPVFVYNVNRQTNIFTKKKDCSWTLYSYYFQSSMILIMRNAGFSVLSADTSLSSSGLMMRHIPQSTKSSKRMSSQGSSPWRKRTGSTSGANTSAPTTAASSGRFAGAANAVFLPIRNALAVTPPGAANAVFLPIRNALAVTPLPSTSTATMVPKASYCARSAARCSPRRTTVSTRRLSFAALSADILSSR